MLDTFNSRFFAAIVVSAASMLTGCASIVNGTNQVISVETRAGDQIVSGAQCKLDNGKGVYFVTTPGTVTVHRAYADMNVKCEKENVAPGTASIKSSTKAMAFGNILFGGVIGAAIDTGSGAAYDYPDLITVVMGEPAPAAASPSSTTPATAPDAATPPSADAAVAVPVAAQTP